MKPYRTIEKMLSLPKDLTPETNQPGVVYQIPLTIATRYILEKQNVEIIEAENGKVGMSLLHKEEIKPDLILLDLMMPVMNGFEFLKSIRETDLNSIPILVLTGADLSEDEKSFLSGEVQRILEKSEDTLSSIVSEVGNVIKTSSKEGGK